MILVVCLRYVSSAEEKLMKWDKRVTDKHARSHLLTVHQSVPVLIAERLQILVRGINQATQAAGLPIGTQER